MPDPIFTGSNSNYNYSYLNHYSYPSPFFDLSCMYHPQTAKELYKWCTYYYYNNPLVSSAINKISRYPITDPIIEDSNENSRNIWKEFFENTFELKSMLMDINLDLNTYGNAYASLKFPFIRFLKCRNCSEKIDIKKLKNISNNTLKFIGTGFQFICSYCKSTSLTSLNKDEIIDVPIKKADEIKLIRWNAENINVKFIESTSSTFYTYRIPEETKRQITNGDLDVLCEIPLIFIEAVKGDKIIRLDPKYLFHLKRPTLAEKDMGQGKPLIMPTLKDLFYQTTLRRAQEAIAKEHIVPFDYIFPVQNGSHDPYTQTNLSSWIADVKREILNHRRDPNYKAVMAVPLGHDRLGGDGRALLITPEIQQLNQTIVGGMGIPIEFLFGGLSWTGSSITLRSLSNDFQHNQTQLLKFALWIKDRVKIFMGWPELKTLRFSEFRMADDMQRLQNLINLHLNGKISHRTLLNELNLDSDEELKMMLSELEKFNTINEKNIVSQTKANGEAQLIQNKFNRKVESEQAGFWADDTSLANTAPEAKNNDIVTELAMQMLMIPEEDAHEFWSNINNENKDLALKVTQKYKELKLRLRPQEPNNLEEKTNSKNNSFNVQKKINGIDMTVAGEGDGTPRRPGIA